MWLPIRFAPGSRKRTKECIASVRHLYIDIDEDGDARLAALRASDAVPVPTAILSTSPGKYQALWRVDGFDFATQEITLKLLASPSAAIPLAPTATGCCASPVSTTGSILPRTRRGRISLRCNLQSCGLPLAG